MRYALLLAAVPSSFLPGFIYWTLVHPEQTTSMPVPVWGVVAGLLMLLVGSAVVVALDLTDATEMIATNLGMSAIVGIAAVLGVFSPFLFSLADHSLDDLSNDTTRWQAWLLFMIIISPAGSVFLGLFVSLLAIVSGSLLSNVLRLIRSEGGSH